MTATAATPPTRYPPLVRWTVALSLATYTLRVASDWQGWHFPDNINLPVHETGHLLFAWGGEVLTALGGTLFQLILPAVFAATFARRADRLGTGVALWWLGESLMNVARYIADARAQLLPLVGGGEHDWAFLLSTWGLLDRDLDLARVARLASVITMALATWWVLRTVERAPDQDPT